MTGDYCNLYVSQTGIDIPAFQFLKTIDLFIYSFYKITDALISFSKSTSCHVFGIFV